MDPQGTDKIAVPQTEQTLETGRKESILELNLVRERSLNAKKEMNDFENARVYVSLIPKDYELVNSLFEKIAAEYKSQAGSTRIFLFNWNNVSGNGNNLKDFLLQKFNADWIKLAKLERSDDGKTLRLIDGDKSVSLQLMNESTVNLKFGDKIYKLQVKQENNDLNVYAGVKARVSKRNYGPKLRHVMGFLCEHAVFNEGDIQEFAGQFLGTEI